MSTDTGLIDETTASSETAAVDHDELDNEKTKFGYQKLRSPPSPVNSTSHGVSSPAVLVDNDDSKSASGHRKSTTLNVVCRWLESWWYEMFIASEPKYSRQIIAAVVVAFGFFITWYVTGDELKALRTRVDELERNYRLLLVMPPDSVLDNTIAVFDSNNEHQHVIGDDVSTQVSDLLVFCLSLTSNIMCL